MSLALSFFAFLGSLFRYIARVLHEGNLSLSFIIGMVGSVNASLPRDNLDGNAIVCNVYALASREMTAV